MIKMLVKFGVWLAVGAASICTLLNTTTLETPWRYTVDSTIGAGSAITISQQGPEGAENGVTAAAEAKVDRELVHAEAPISLSTQKTVDVGAPLTLIGVYVLGGIMAYVLKGRRRKG